MDFKVYTKETISQPSGTVNVITPNVIDIYPVMAENDVLAGAEILDKESEILEQACALATIWQKGLDPIEPSDGIRWSEAILEEVNVVQLMEDITNAVAQITNKVSVEFSTVIDSNGNSYLQYTLRGGN